MAEDIWQNLPYPVAEASVFERGWPTVPAEWRAAAEGGYSADTDAAVRELLLTLRPRVNRLLEACRRQPAAKAGSEASGESQGASEAIGSSLEAQVQLELTPGEESRPVAEALALLAQSQHPEVDNLADWLLVSALRVGGEAPDQVLAEASEAGLTARIARAEGSKCERCWHYETDIGQHAVHPSVCGRCVAVLEG
jgi:isoleucyl-tRNA synthetase